MSKDINYTWYNKTTKEKRKMLNYLLNILPLLFLYGFIFHLKISLLVYVFIFLILPSIAALMVAVEIEGTWVIENSSLCKHLGVKGLAIWPVVFVERSGRTAKRKKPNRIVRHERIHLAQQLECLILPFYILYGAEEIIRQLIYRQPLESAYRDISFEKEAYQNEKFDSHNYFKKKRNRCEWWKMYLVRES